MNAGGNQLAGFVSVKDAHCDCYRDQQNIYTTFIATDHAYMYSDKHAIRWQE